MAKGFKGFGQPSGQSTKSQSTKKDRATSRKDRSTKNQSTKKDRTTSQKDRLKMTWENSDKTASVSSNSLKAYQAFLKKNMERPCLLTGRKHFPWEERYRLGQGSEAEYKIHKQTNATYTDTFDFLGFEPKQKTYSIHIKVKRVSDQRKFELPLHYLKSVDRKHPNAGLISDYTTWFENK